MGYWVICGRFEDGRQGYGLLHWDGTELLVRADLSSDPETVLDLAERCDRGRLWSGHLDDIIEDFLADLG